MSSQYQPSGNVNPGRLILSVAALLPLGAVLAWALSAATITGWYYIMITPAIALLPLAGAGKMLAAWSHMRSPWLGFVLGAAMGVLVYLGQFYALLITEAGPLAVTRLDVLPAYTMEVVSTQVISKHFGQGEPSPWLNWTVFCFELALCASMAGSPWYLIGRNPYCERCQRWLIPTTTHFSGGAARALAEALAAGNLDDLPTLEPIFGNLPGRYGEMELTGCLHGGNGEDAIFFVSVSETVRDGENKQTKKLADQVALCPGDVMTLYDRCPGLHVEPAPV